MRVSKRMFGSLILGAMALVILPGCPIPGEENPKWLEKLIERIEGEPVADPPAQIARYAYDGQTAYYQPPRCCDIMSDLYDADGNIICHPDGGISGGGDGRCPDFFDEAEFERLVWQDQR